MQEMATAKFEEKSRSSEAKGGGISVQDEDEDDGERSHIFDNSLIGMD
jgi:hypothetical protein